MAAEINTHYPKFGESQGTQFGAVRFSRHPCPRPPHHGKYSIVYVGYYSAMKKNEIMPFAATWMDLEIITLNEVSQKEKDTYCISLICGI